MDGKLIAPNPVQPSAQYVYSDEAPASAKWENNIAYFYELQQEGSLNNIQSVVTDGKNASGGITAININNFINYALANHGYYIARYEASYGGEDIPLSQESKGIPKVVEHEHESEVTSITYEKGQLWNCVTQKKAADVSKNMYSLTNGKNKNEYYSDLINGYAWDTAIIFMELYSGNTNYAINNGTTISMDLKNTGKTSDKVCNVYDMGANLLEWDTEYCASSTRILTKRGARYLASEDLVGNRMNNNLDASYCYIGFRENLYVVADVQENTQEDTNTLNSIKTRTDENVPIPTGFKYIEGDLSTGLVIENEQEGSQFVWIPVSDPSTIKTTSLEPSNLLSTYDNKYNLAYWKEGLYQEEFNKMKESISKYNGFYVGRYESSLNIAKIQSKAGMNPICNQTWYKMYAYSRAYSKSNLGVNSEMIWGCQWDKMIDYISSGKDASHVNSSTNCVHGVTTAYKTGGIDYPYGITAEYSDIANNIYDLEGNMGEWTQEQGYDKNNPDAHNSRYFRGGLWRYSGYSMSGKYQFVANNIKNYVGTRLSLYIK